jgi:hypothetical protein
MTNNEGLRNDVWYQTSGGKDVTKSEMIATWWENRIRTENGETLKEFYSFSEVSNGGKVTSVGDERGRLLVSGTSTSTVINQFGRLLKPHSTIRMFGISFVNPESVPYRY